MRDRWSLGYVIPRLLVAVFLVDAALRFVSIDSLTFRAWEAVSRYRPAGAAFEPNRRYRNARSYGDLTAMGNLPGLRQYRMEVFTTDALGFRNAAHVFDTQIRAILIGDSFAVGSGVSDDETVSSRLGQFWGCVVYNAGSEAWAVVPDQILPVLPRLALRGRPVIRLYSEDSEVPYVPTTRGRILRQLVAGVPAEIRGVAGRVEGLLTVSPLRILSERALKTLENDRVLPNSYAGNVVKASLRNGDAMLFRTSHVHNFYRSREVAADYWMWLRDALWRRGTTWWSSSCPANTRCTGRSSWIRGNRARARATISSGSRVSCGRWESLFSTSRRSSPHRRRAIWSAVSTSIGWTTSIGTLAGSRWRPRPSGHGGLRRARRAGRPNL